MSSLTTVFYPQPHGTYVDVVNVMAGVLRHPYFFYSLVLTAVWHTTIAAALYIKSDMTRDIWVYAGGSFLWYLASSVFAFWGAGAIILWLRRSQVRSMWLELAIATMFSYTGNCLSIFLVSAYYGRPEGGVPDIRVWGSWVIMGYFVASYIEYRNREIQTQKVLTLARAKTMDYLLGPHFLFNSLNTISAFIRDKPDLAEHAVQLLADILRKALRVADAHLVPLREEFQAMRNYLCVEQYRFGELLHFEFDLPESLENVSIPPLLIQPAIENAIKHGLTINGQKVSVKAYEDEQRVFVRISDSGRGFPEHVLSADQNSGIGLRALEARIEQMPKGKLELANDDGAVVLLSWEA